MKLLEVQLSLASRYFVPLPFKYPPPPKCMNMRAQVSHLYKTTGKFIVSDVLITYVKIRYSATDFHRNLLVYRVWQ